MDSRGERLGGGAAQGMAAVGFVELRQLGVEVFDALDVSGEAGVGKRAIVGEGECRAAEVAEGEGQLVSDARVLLSVLVLLDRAGVAPGKVEVEDVAGRRLLVILVVGGC